MKKWLLSILLWSSMAATGQQQRVAIIDTGINPSDPRFSSLICKGHTPFDFVANKPLTNDYHGHGTHVAGLIKRYAEGANFCLLVYRYYSENNTGAQNLNYEVLAMKKAIEEQATIINFSGGGPSFSEEEYLVIKANPNVKFVVAAGNEKENIDYPGNEYYPASYRVKNVIPVGAMDSECKAKLPSSNFGKRVSFWELGDMVRSDLQVGKGYMSGTSQATAIHTGKILAGKETTGCQKQTD